MKKNNQLGSILPLLRFPKVKKSDRKSLADPSNLQELHQGDQAICAETAFPHSRPVASQKNWPLRSALNEAAQHSRYKAQIPPLATFRFCLTH
jgi:hypothetical protein